MCTEFFLLNKLAIVAPEIPEPKIWFHDIYRIDGSPFDQKEVDFIKNFLS